MWNISETDVAGLYPSYPHEVGLNALRVALDKGEKTLFILKLLERWQRLV